MKKLINKIILLSLLSTTFFANAQIQLEGSEPTVDYKFDKSVQPLIKVVEYKGATIGYAIACKVDDSKLTNLQENVKQYLLDLKLSSGKTLYLWKEFAKIVEQKKVANLSSEECKHITQEVDKINTMIKK